jgi:hypothetical protein
VTLQSPKSSTSNPKIMDDAQGLAIAFEEAKISYAEGGIPV